VYSFGGAALLLLVEV